MGAPHPNPVTAVLSTPDFAQNALIRALPAAAIANLGDVRPLFFKAPFVVQPAGERLKFALFPLDTMFSVIMHLKDGSTVEVASIAAEGTLAETALSQEAAMFEYSCEIGGHALAMSTGTLERLARCYPAFREATEHFLRYLVFRMGQIAACNCHHSVLQRTARWLLTAHDCGNDRISVTHERLAALLGSRRAGISASLARLQWLRSVSCGHRYIAVTNRRVLEQAACECYATLKAKLPEL